jgi:pantetheine-phosphate adenylyltransferase
MYNRAIFPGTFDPFTNGHLAIVRRGLELFDHITIAIAINPDKKNRFTPEERLTMITRIFKDQPRIKVRTCENLTVDLAEEENARFILRGIRTASDFDYERTIATVNRKLSGIETVALFAEPETEHISSTLVRQLLTFNKSADRFLPPGTLDRET